MISGYPRRTPNSNKVKLSGIDHGGEGTIVKETAMFVIVVWPAHTGWSGVGETSYYPASLEVYRKGKQAQSFGHGKKVEYWEHLIEMEMSRGWRKGV